MNRFYLVLAVAVAGMIEAGCSAFPTSKNDSDPEAADQTSKVDIHAPFPVMYRAGIEQIKLIELLAGEQEGRRISEIPRDVDDPKHGISWSTKYDLAFTAFYQRNAADAEAQKLERNRVQERILAASDQRCRMFKVNLQRDQSRTNFWFGALGTLSGALGAVAGGAQAAKNFAATSGVLSGVRAEYDQAFYSNLLFSVISGGIEEKRKEAYRQIQQEGQTKSIAAYPVEAAVKDAILYDGLCNTAVGLEQAQESIRLVADPGVDAMNRLIVKANLTRDILDKKITDVQELAKSGTDPNAGTLTSRAGRLDFGSYLGSKDSESPVQIDALVQVEKGKIDGNIQATIDRLKYPDTLSADDKAKLRNSIAAAVAPFKASLFGRFDSCVQTDGANAVQKLIVAQNQRYAAIENKDDQKRDLAALEVKSQQSQLDLLVMKLRQLSAQFAKGLGVYAAGLDKAVAAAKQLKDVALTIPEALSQKGGAWSYGDSTKCSG